MKKVIFYIYVLLGKLQYVFLEETVNEFKRKTRRVSLSVTFGSQLEILVDDVSQFDF